MKSQYDREYFEDNTTGYLLFHDFPVHWKVVQHLLARKPKSLLDIGGARGYVARKLSDRGIPATCMDMSEYCWYTRATDSFVLHDITDTPWPFTDKQFDLVFSSAVLEHIKEEHIPKIIKEICRVSKRAFLCPSLDNIPDDHDATHETLKPISWWIEMFQKHGEKGYEIEIMDKEDLQKGTIAVPPSDGLVKLNLGSFLNMFHFGWRNIDIENVSNFAKQNGYLFDSADLSKPDYLNSYPKNSVDCIYTSHMLEHFDRDAGKRILQQSFDILRDGGVIRICVPDAQQICDKYLDSTISDYGKFNIGVEKSPDDAQSLYEMLLSGHKTVYDYESLLRILKHIGFAKVRTMEQGKSMHMAIAKQTIDTYPEHSLTIEAIKSIPDSEQIISTRPSKKLKVALVSTPMLKTKPTHYGGLELIVHDIGQVLGINHDVDVIAAKGSYVPKCKIIETIEPINTTKVDWLGAEKQHYEKYKMLLGDYDIIHDHTWFGFSYLYKKDNPDTKIIHTHHGGLSWKTRPTALPNMVAISEYMKAVYAVLNWTSKRVYNGIDLNMYPFSNKERDRLVFIGRIDKFKQPHMAIEVAKKLDMKLDIIGGTFVQDQNYLNEIRKQCDGKKIIMYENASHVQKVSSLSKAYATIFPSKMGEPFGLVAPESMAVGTPVIITPDGAIPEVVSRPDVGRICGTVDDMVYTIKNELTSFSPINCREHVAKHFTKEIMTKNYEKLYREILEGREW